MRRLALWSMAVMCFAWGLGCNGPQKMTRSLDEYVNNGYIESPWLYGNMLSRLIVAAATGLTWCLDSIINVYYFWVDDAKPFGTGHGTAYPFKAVTPTQK